MQMLSYFESLSYLAKVVVPANPISPILVGPFCQTIQLQTYAWRLP
jgi:hypothetical protein